MLQHTNSIEKINRLHTEAKNVRLVRETKPYSVRRALAKSLTNIANRLDSVNLNNTDNELDIQFDRKATA